MILLLIISALTPIFTVKVNHRAKLIQGLYVNVGDIYDVALMGSSHMNGAVNPNVLWGKYGITSYNYATGGQPIDVTYYLLIEFLKKHQAKVVVLDVYYLGLVDEFGQEGYIRYVLDNMKFSLNKIAAIVNCTPPDQWLYYFIPFFKYHDRWKELKKADFEYVTSSSYYTKGFGAGRTSYGKDNTYTGFTSDEASIPPKMEKYLYKFIELSKEKGFSLVFTLVPHDYNSTAHLNYWHKEPQKMFNRVAKIAKENGIPFINYNNMFDEIGFDFKKDMYNNGHTNIYGAEKVSTHLGKFLMEKYHLKDHRGDEKYASWESDYALYLQKEKEAALKENEDKAQ